jgi:type I restriction enzyme R subunit
VDKETIDKAFAAFKEEAALTDEEADALNQRSAKMAAFLKAPERVAKIVEDIAKHFNEKVAPHGLKAMIVTPDRYACVQYKEELDKYLPQKQARWSFPLRPMINWSSSRNGVWTKASRRKS